MSQKPYIGAIVHYFEQPRRGNEKPRAAIIIDVHDDKWVALKIFSHGGAERYASHVEQGLGWDWIPESLGLKPAQLGMYGWADGIGG